MNEDKQIAHALQQSRIVTAYSIEEVERIDVRSSKPYFIFLIEMEIMRLNSNDDSTLLLSLTRQIRNIINPKKRVNFVIEFTM
jgi:hypothetical protein